MASHRPIRPIPLTVGGIPALTDIVGRGQQAAAVVSALARDSVLLTGDRRIGKTSLSKLVERSLEAAGTRVIRVSAERTSMADFESALADQLATTVCGAAAEELRRWTVTVKTPIAEAQRANRPPTLDHLVRIATTQPGLGPLVMIIDEVPILARALESQHPSSGLELLASLRRVRQESDGRVSMLLMGSMGFHHVAAQAPGEVNDVSREAVGGLADEDGVYLARCLMLGAGVEPSSDQQVAEAINSEVEGVPFYIQHLVKDAQDVCTRSMLTPARVGEIVERAIVHPDDPWQLRHYRDRVPQYYGADQAETAYATIDVFAHATAPVGIDDCLRQLGTSLSMPPTRSVLVQLVEKLEQDHYLTRVGSESTFRSELLRRAWLALRR